MARIFCVGGGDRALALAGALRPEGHAFRIAAVDPGRVRAVGGEPVEGGDPDVVGTLRYALDNVTVLLWLLGDDARPELHGSRWRMMLERTIDTTVRGVVYERGTDEGVAITAEMADRNEIPYAVVDCDDAAWAGTAREAVYNLLKADRISRR